MERLPLVFALKHLQISWPLDRPDAACLMQGNREIAAAPDGKLDDFLTRVPHGTLPDAAEREMLAMMTPPEWTDDVRLAFHGITAFGARDLAVAEACAHHVLSRNPTCLLARQLVSLLTASSEVRCAFGVDVESAPDVPRIVGATADGSALGSGT